MSASGGIYSLSDIDQFPFLAFGTHKHIGAVDKKLTPSRYFRTLAYGAPPKLDYKQILDQPEMRDFVPVRNRVYLEHLEHLVTCYSLAGYGTIWWNNDHSAATVFAFENAQLDLGFDVKEIEDLLNGEVYSGQQWSRRFKVNGIYRLVLN